MAKPLPEPKVVEIPFAYVTKDGPVPRNPVVRARIKGREILMIIDTGATSHVIDAGLARELGLKGAAAEKGEDHYGRKIEVSDLEDVPVEIGPWKGSLTHPSGIAADPSLLADRILGTVSPQCLIESGIVVLDIPRRKILVAEKAKVGARQWLSKRYPRFEFIELERRGREMLVDAALPGRSEVPVLLNTGSGPAEFSAAYAGLDPGVYKSTEAVRVGGRELRVPSIEVRSFKGQDYMAGILGLDAIHELIVAFRTESSKVILGFPKR